MSGTEIKTKVDALTDELNNRLKTFVLTGRIAEIMEEIEGLRNECTHDFVNGVCIYCGKEENE